MGQRHQIYYVIKRDDEYTAVGAYHHQWCYGLKASSNAVRTVKILEDQDYLRGDKREIETIAKAVYGLSLDNQISMVHNESEWLIDDDNIMPAGGDNNDGCTLYIIDLDKKEFRACMFTPGHLEGNYYDCDRDGQYKAWDLNEYLAFYYNTEDLNETGMEKEKALVADHNVKPISQKELDLVLKAQLKALKETK